MNIETLFLKDFRNYTNLHLDLKQCKRVALVGDNAQGKSNLLESLYLLAFASSYRNQKPTDLIRWGTSSAQILSTCRHQRGDSFTLAFEARKNGKRLVQVNYEYQRRLSDFVGRFKMVFFSQQDLLLITGPPAKRRLFMDLLLVQLRPAYYGLLHTYHRVLQQRNSLLRTLKYKPHLDSESLDLWDYQLAETGSKIFQYRDSLFKDLTAAVSTAHQDISGQAELLQLRYCPSSSVHSEDTLKQIQQRRKQDILQGYTSIGPHRDELQLTLSGKELKSIGSQGQIRTAALAMKIGELLYAAENLGEYPVLLLDDVFSDLDPHRQKQLIQQIFVPELQFILTTTHLSTDVETLLKKDDQGIILQVESGQIR